MFFKRISDVYLEEYGHALADSGGDHEFAAFAENHRFAIPEGCLWQDVRERTENIGQALVTAFREIEKANPDTLYGIFGNAACTRGAAIMPAAEAAVAARRKVLRFMGCSRWVLQIDCICAIMRTCAPSSSSTPLPTRPQLPVWRISLKPTCR